MKGKVFVVTTGARAYLDWNATAPMRPEAARAYADVLGRVGNASSVHAEGRAARAAVEAARAEVAALVGARSQDVVFTGSGSEANALALAPGFRAVGEPERTRLLVGAGEHPCVLDGHRFPADAVRRIPLDAEGRVDLAALERMLAEQSDAPTLVSVQLANNETGVIQPMAEVAWIAKAAGARVHCDAVQGPGRIPVSLEALGVDALTLSAHKIGGPQGVGALVLADGSLETTPLVRGGGQERGRRAGTENVAGIVAFGAAARAVREGSDRETARLDALHAAFAAEIDRIAPDAIVFGAGAPRLPNTILFALPGVRAETALIGFDLAGVSLSSGSACSSGKVKRSHVLDAMGVAPDLAEGALRLSWGHATGDADVRLFASALETIERRRGRGTRAA